MLKTAVFLVNFPASQLKANIQAIRQEIAFLKEAASIPSCSRIGHAEPDTGQMYSISLSESNSHRWYCVTVQVVGDRDFVQYIRVIGEVSPNRYKPVVRECPPEHRENMLHNPLN